MKKPVREVTRREEYAAATRQAIFDAAHLLFAKRGYFATKVDDIAAKARVAPATVYAVAGGKQGLLQTLIETWTTDPVISATLERVSALDDPLEIVTLTAASSRDMRERFADVIRVMLTTAPHDPDVAQQLEVATKRYREAIAVIACRLLELGALPAGTTMEHASDVLWFYFGYGSYFTLHNECGWPYEKAERWLADQACRALFGTGRGARPRNPARRSRRS
jgi:AcrR family transcriptional regulator